MMSNLFGHISLCIIFLNNMVEDNVSISIYETQIGHVLGRHKVNQTKY